MTWATATLPPYAKTPHLDRLASQGTRFEQFYVSGVTCCSSRTGFMTSKYEATYQRYPSSNGFGDRVTVTELLKTRGYRTGHFGKWHIGPPKSEVNGMYGIDEVDIIGHNHEVPEGRDADMQKQLDAWQATLPKKYQRNSKR